MKNGCNIGDVLAPPPISRPMTFTYTLTPPPPKAEKLAGNYGLPVGADMWLLRIELGNLYTFAVNLYAAATAKELCDFFCKG